MNENFSEFEKQFKADEWSKRVLIAGIVIYAGAVLFGFFRNLQLFAPTFAGVEYAQVGYFAVAILALNAFILPLFIHKRASGAQFWAAITFYVLEMIIYVMNASVEPRAAMIAEGKADPFLTWYYWNVAFVAPIVVMVAWGIIFLLDPESQMSRAIAEARGTLVGQWATKARVAAHTTSMDAKVTEQASEFVEGMSYAILPKNGEAKAQGITAEQYAAFVAWQKQHPDAAQTKQQDAPTINFYTPPTS